MSTEDYLANTVRYNVVDDATTSTANQDVRRRVEYLMKSHLKMVGWAKAHFLFVGRSTLNAAPQPFRNLHFAVRYCHDDWGHVMCIPHPSGRNRFYNSEANTRLVQESLRKFLGSF